MRASSMVAAVVAGLTALGLLAGCTSGIDAGAPGASAPAASDPAGSEPTASAQPGSAESGGLIPSEAVLQPADVGADRFESLPPGEAANLRPIRPCDARYPGDATRTAAVARQALVMPPAGGAKFPILLLQYVGLHPGDGPAAFAEMVNAVRACPGTLQGDQYTWELAGTDIAGDESVLVRATRLMTYGPGPATPVTTPIVVARVGDYVMVLADRGWENLSGDETSVRTLSVKAVERLRRYG